jgi:MFS family permease
VDAATFLLSAALLTRVRPRPRGEPLPTGPTSIWAELRDGLREVRSRAWVWATLASFCVALFCGLAPWFVLGPVVAREQYGHLGVYGVVEAAFGFGTVLGAVTGLGWRPRFPMRLAMLAMLLWPLSSILFAAGVSLVIVVPASVVAGAGLALVDVWGLTALAERIPPAKLSRVTSYDWMVSLGLLPLGFLLAGPLASALGAVEVLIGGSVLAFLAFALGLLPRETRRLERLGEGEGMPPMEEPLHGLAQRGS